MTRELAKGIAGRIREAIKLYELRTGEDLTWAELGRRVWKRLKREGEVDTSKLSRIKLGQQLLTIPEAGAFADELGVFKGWLAFREGRMRPDSPEDYPAGIRLRSRINTTK